MSSPPNLRKFSNASSLLTGVIPSRRQWVTSQPETSLLNWGRAILSSLSYAVLTIVLTLCALANRAQAKTLEHLNLEPLPGEAVIAISKTSNDHLDFNGNLITMNPESLIRRRGSTIISTQSFDISEGNRLSGLDLLGADFSKDSNYHFGELFSMTFRSYSGTQPLSFTHFFHASTQRSYWLEGDTNHLAERNFHFFATPKQLLIYDSLKDQVIEFRNRPSQTPASSPRYSSMSLGARFQIIQIDQDKYLVADRQQVIRFQPIPSCPQLDLFKCHFEDDTTLTCEQPTGNVCRLRLHPEKTNLSELLTAEPSSSQPPKGFKTQFINSARTRQIWSNTQIDVFNPLKYDMNGDWQLFAGGKTSPFPAKAILEQNHIQFFLPIDKKVLILSRKNVLSYQTNDQFWQAFDKNSWKSFFQSAKVLGKVATSQDLNDLVAKMSLLEQSPQSSFHKQGSYYYSQTVTGFQYIGSTSQGVADTNNLKEINVGAIPTITPLGSTEFILISSVNHTVGTSFLFDLSSGRAWDLGAAISGELSVDQRRLITSAYRENRLIDLASLRLNARWRVQPVTLPDRPVLPIESFSKCEVDARQAPSLAQHLMQMRQKSFPLHESDFKYVLGYQLNQDEIILLAQVLQRWFLEAPEKVMFTMRRLDLFDRLASHGLRKAVMNPCLTDQDKEALAQSTIAPVLQVINSTSGYSGVDVDSFSYLLFMSPLYRERNIDTAAFRESLTGAFANAAGTHPYFRQVFVSKLHYMMQSVVNVLMGDLPTFKTDATILPQERKAAVLLLSSYPIYGKPVFRTPFGIYSGRVDTISLEEKPGSVASQEYQYFSGGHKFRAKIKITTKGNLTDLTPRLDGAMTDAFLKDGKITGMMITGLNLTRQLGLTARYQYFSFFRDRGYLFQPAVQNENVPALFEQLVRSGELDYLIKEAHSDGDERNLFRIAQRGSVMVGQKQRADGRIEKIYLVTMTEQETVPSHLEPEPSNLISNQHFGEWIRSREQSGLGPLVYLNTSCSSAYKVVNEVTAAHSPLFIPIPSLSSVNVFSNNPRNAIGILMSGLLTGKRWSDMRQDLDAVDKEHKIDYFALPHEEAYAQSVRSRLGLSIDSEVELWDLSLGKKIDVDQYNQH